MAPGFEKASTRRTILMLTRNRNRSFSKALQQGTAMTLISMMAFSGTAMAQDAIVSSSQAGAPVAAAADEDIQEVVVVGARAAQQSSNDRKKRAKTAMDSIVADDVGAFPDKNLNEAISRVAGVALQRDEFGEGSGIDIRGNTAEQTRVELDGMGVSNASFALSGTQNARGADMVALPSDLIKSVDVIKGSTADMTEGSLGGGVKIQTRTGLDFKKPYLSLRVGARRNSLGEQWKPDYNLVASRKFLNDRLGVVLSLTGSNYQNNSSSQGTSANNTGYLGRLDFDGSAEKTFEFNPSTVGGTGVGATLSPDTLLANSSFTPRQIVERSASAQTKAACSTAFPLLTTGTAAVKNQRVYELQTCLNQWNDLEPNLVRSYDNTQLDERFSADIRFDYKISDNFTVFAKYNKSTREVDRQYRWRSLQGGQETPINPGNIYTTAGNPNGVWNIAAGSPYQQRVVSPTAAGKYFLYDGVGIYNNNPAIGNVVGIDPSSVKVDENHFVTEYVLTDASSNITQSWEPFDTTNTFAQFGGNYNSGPLKIDFMVGKSEADYKRFNISTNRSFNYGAARFFVQPSGLWSHEILGNYDETNPANYVQLNSQAAITTAVAPTYEVPAGVPVTTVAQRPLVSNSFALNFDAWIGESTETTAKIDVTYNLEDKLPFFSAIKIGLSQRNPQGKAWSRPGGRTISNAVGTYLNTNGTVNPNYIPAVVLPSTLMRGSFRACQPTATSIESCNYGYVPATNMFNALTGVTTYTPAEMQALIAATISQPDSNFFNGYEGAENMENWQGIDVEKLVSLVPSAQNYNFDCMKSCVASDGKVYDQFFQGYDEKITAAYYMAEFEQPLPLGMELIGNFGLRAVETEATGQGAFTLQSVRTTAAFDPLNPTAAAGIVTTSYTQQVEFTRTTRDYLPTYNVGVWVVPDQVVVRYYKGKTISRPGVNFMLPAGTCTVDERRELDVIGFDGDNSCSVRVGNPELKPYTAWDQNLSVEWYPNRDTMLSLATHKLDVLIGNVVGTSATGKLFAGSDYVDPVTGQALADLEFTYPTYENAPGIERTGWEFTSKTAFTFLPWYFRYTGADFNYSKLESKGATNIINPNTGEVMPPQRESDYFANLSLWYDDGKTNARITYQARGEYFICIESCGSNGRNNYPSEIGFDARPAPYQPGNAVWQDETKYVDAKITHKFRPNVEFYVEGRNLTKQGTTTSNGADRTFADGTPTVHNLNYGGRTFSFGVTYRMQ
ncbi:TonB-dependent receptor [Asticcacaulis endophyticus]|nr:TonB-dependent receptor [Asticcacaulis endophyticus]